MILIIGIPNAGKTQYSMQYKDVIHFDDVWSTNIYEYLREEVRRKNDVCIEGVFGNRSNREILVNESTKRNTCIWLDTPLEVCLERERKGRKRSDHLVLWANEDFEPPTLEEGWDEIIIIRGDEIERISRQTET